MNADSSAASMTPTSRCLSRHHLQNAEFARNTHTDALLIVVEHTSFVMIHCGHTILAMLSLCNNTSSVPTTQYPSQQGGLHAWRQKR